MAGRRWLSVVLVCAGLLIAGGGTFLLLRSDDPAPDDALTEVSPTAAQAEAGGPCPYEPIPAGLEPFRNPPEERARKHRLDTTLTVKYTKRSEVSLGGCRLHLRSYNGRLFGPTLRLKPRDDLNLTLRNRLPVPSADEVEEQFQQEFTNAHIVHRPVPFNTTNVHYHGMHVSPRGNSDNVLLEIEPQTTFDYEVDVPKDQPPGTYWYHAHAHGSTAVQVASGMAGALIVDDDPREIPAALRAANRHEKIMLFQSILYDTNGELETIESLFGGSQKGDDCVTGGPKCKWPGSQRRMTVNGQIVPEIHMRPGEVQRWRMIDATFSEILDIQLEGHELHEIALDGNYLGRVDTWGPDQTIHMGPGYRSDVLVKASATPGTYDLVDMESSKDESLRDVAEDSNVLARIVISGDPMDMRLPNDDDMAPFAPFPQLENISEEVTGVETVVFKLGHDAKATDRFYFTVNYAAFDPDNVRTVFKNNIDEWRLGTVGDDDGFPTPGPTPSPAPLGPLPHVFHIHVNPFQVVRKDPDGNDEAVWKDTLIVDGPPVSVYTKYTDFTGKIVIHCHLLDHEDLGMMEVVNIKEGTLDPGSTHH